MKKTLIIAVLLFLSTIVNGQIKLGISGGFNIADLKTNHTTESRTFINFGITGEMPVTEGLSMQIGVGYMSKGAIRPAELGDPRMNIKLTYIDIPILAKYKIGKVLRPYIIAGPVISMLLKSEIEATIGALIFKGDAKEVCNSLDFGLCIGCGAEYEIGNITLFTQLHYIAGISNVTKGGTFILNNGSMNMSSTVAADELIKNKNINIMIGAAILL